MSSPLKFNIVEVAWQLAKGDEKSCLLKASTIYEEMINRAAIRINFFLFLLFY